MKPSKIEIVHTPWHKWFAWYPVLTVGQQWVWFECVYRCRSQAIMHENNDVTWAFKTLTLYGTIVDVLKDTK